MADDKRENDKAKPFRHGNTSALGWGTIMQNKMASSMEDIQEPTIHEQTLNLGIIYRNTCILH